MKYCPEGINEAFRKRLNTLDDVKTAIKTGEIMEGRVILCDREHNLHIDVGEIAAVIPYNEGAVGIIEGTLRDIALISKVNKWVCFKVKGIRFDNSGKPIAVLSRRSVQLDCLNSYINKLVPGDVIQAKVTRLESFGAFIDIGSGINSLIPIDMLSVSRISHPKQRLKEGQVIKTVLKSREFGKMTFSLKELLGTWQQNADNFDRGETVTGVVRSVEEYGVFVELLPNLAGLAESEYQLKEGQCVSVFIKSLLPEKMKIKLVIVDSFDEETSPMPLNYYVDEGEHISHWQYSPSTASKQIYTEF